MNGYAEGLATKGILGNTISVATKGYLVKITIEETPITPGYGGGGHASTVGWNQISRKFVKVTVEINDEVFAEAKEINADVAITTNDINIEFNNDKPTVRVKHIGILNKV